ncbi:helix-turn-helix domain-containing protein [Actinoplanes sp. CA-142083]|uniref:helix-turn-helix domain-containing protein n=1 Tax=Actinoplanes sp. CA-142083 TaxID=3239903 RepID=UPI003D8C40E6
MSSTLATPLLLTPEQAAAQLGIGRTKMFALIGGGEVESVTIGRHRRVPTDALAAYVERLRAQQASTGAAA